MTLLALAALGTLWTQPKACAPFRFTGTAGDLLSVDGHTVQARDRKTGAARTLVKLPSSVPATVVMLVTADTLVVRDPRVITAVDPASGAVRWHRSVPMGAASAAGGGSVVVAARGKDAVEVEVVDASSSGAGKWTASLGAHDDVGWAAIGTSHVYVVTRDGGGAVKRTSTLIALGRADGKVAWTVALDDWTTPELAGDDVVVALGTVAIIDGKTGKVDKLATHADRLAVHDGRAYVIDLTAGTNVVAIDVATRKTLWTQALSAFADFGGATASAVVVVEDRETLRVLDAKTGAVGASYGIGADPDIEVIDGAPLVITCDQTALVGLDPSVSAPDETATITGTIHCGNCGRGERIPIASAGVTATTDEHGHFSIRVTGRGSFAIRATLAPGYGPQTIGSVSLTGKMTYDVGKREVEAPDGE